MDFKKRNILLYGVIGVLSIIAIYLYTQNIVLEESLTDEQGRYELLLVQEQALERISSIDSLVATGNYEEALAGYEEELAGADSSMESLVRSRIDLVKNLVRDRARAMEEDTSTNQVIDTTVIARNATIEEVKKYDSISFALQKARVQIEYLKRQLKQRNSGEYLTFTSDKGNKVYYVGQVKNGMANGVGVALWNTGSRYEGEWKDNRRHGKGVFYWQDGEYYEGEYKEGKRHGFGTYYWPNGDKYIGEWQNDRRSGEGKFYNADGELVASGIWRNDELVEVEKK